MMPFENKSQISINNNKFICTSYRIERLCKPHVNMCGLEAAQKKKENKQKIPICIIKSRL